MAAYTLLAAARLHRKPLRTAVSLSVVSAAVKQRAVYWQTAIQPEEGGSSPSEGRSVRSVRSGPCEDRR